MEVYRMLLAFCNEVAVTWRKTQRVNLALAGYAVLKRKTFTLSHLAQALPRTEVPKVPEVKHSLWHRLKRLRRFLANPRLEPAEVQRRLSCLSLSLSDEPGLRLSILLDLTYWEPYAFLVASVPKLGRALPIAWRAFRRDLVGESVESQNLLVQSLLQTLFGWLPPRLQVVLVGDREFADVKLFRFLKAQQRAFVIRVDAATWLRHPTYTGALGELGLRPGDAARWFVAAQYGKEAREVVNLLAVWVKGYKEPWLLATTLDDVEEVFAIYKQRMKIEHGFRDWKTHLRLKGTLWAQNVAYVKGLMTVLAVLYWFVALLGLQWTERRHWSRVACWGQPGFFKVALDLLSEQDPLVPQTWPSVHAWLREKLAILRPLPPAYLLRYRRHRFWLPQTG
jgi:hypothetical protein